MHVADTVMEFVDVQLWTAPPPDASLQRSSVPSCTLRTMDVLIILPYVFTSVMDRNAMKRSAAIVSAGIVSLA
jgi:hypothetical protein